MSVRPPGISEPRASARAGRISVASVAAFFMSFAACAGIPGVPPNHGFNFATITHQGNAPTLTQNHLPGQTPLSVGRVDYTYRITTKEVTGSQWFEFAQAYAPFVAENQAGSGGLAPHFGGVRFEGFNQQGVPTYSLNQALAQQPVDPTWRFAARFVNWLHNGARPAGLATAADFASGAYDTSTFTSSPNPAPPPSTILNDQAVRSEGALFWIPNLDEWVKAAYFDPDRFGPGQPGYWDYPITSDTAPIPDRPENGGQTNTGPFPGGTAAKPLNVGSYPTVVSPWGLLDTSGGLSEWLEDRDFRGFRLVVGSSFGNTGEDPAVIDLLVRRIHNFQQYGLRIASAVPSPSASLSLGVALAFTSFRRDRRCRSLSPSRSP